MAKSTSTYGRKVNPVHGPHRAAPFGLCSTHHTNILSDGDCWECDGPAIGIYDPDAFTVLSGRQLADAVRSALAARDELDPEGASALRTVLNSARATGSLNEDLLHRVLGALSGEIIPAADDEIDTTPGPAMTALAASEAKATTHRTNKFAGRCTSCNGWVEAEAGQLDKVADKWVVKHLGTCPEVLPVATPQLPEVPDGRYAIASTGDNDLVFYHVTSSDKWGKSVQMIVGGQDDTFVARRNVEGILGRIMADTYERPTQYDADAEGAYTIPAGTFTGAEGAALRYADEFVRCSRCRRQLTDRQSRLDGIGPVCITK